MISWIGSTKRHQAKNKHIKKPPPKHPKLDLRIFFGEKNNIHMAVCKTCDDIWPNYNYDIIYFTNLGFPDISPAISLTIHHHLGAQKTRVLGRYELTI